MAICTNDNYSVNESLEINLTKPLYKYVAKHKSI